MKSPKNTTLLVLVLILLFSLPLFGFDFGLSVDSTTSVSLPLPAEAEEALGQRIKASLWTDHFWTTNNDAALGIAAQGIYVYTLDRPYLFDLERLEFTYRIPEVFGGAAIASGSAGRFFYSDPTGYILNHRIDGARFSLDFRGTEVRIGAGYTGLLLKEESGILYSDADFADQNDTSKTLSPKRVFEGIDVIFTQLLPRQRLTLGVFSQQDLRGSEQEHSLYGHLGLTGPLARGLFYSLTGALGTDLESANLGYLAQVTSSYFLPSFANSRFALGFLTTNEEFKPLSLASLGNLHNPGLSSASRLQVSWALRPWGNYYNPLIRNLGFEIDWKSFFDFAAAEKTDGNEVTATVNFRPTSDLGVSFLGGMYIPSGGVDPEFLLQLLVSLGF
ncbi:MAG: hypothetical protein GW949_10270 [Spirochaetales bacterium]|nr:hypothetical protein [Spirochaetales bacterium]